MPTSGPAARGRRGPVAGAGAGEAWLLFAVAFVLRAAYTWFAMGPDATPFSDSASYHAVAVNLARGAGFALNGATGPYPTAFVPPVLPFVTSLLYRVAGPNFFAALLLMCVFGALVPVTLAELTRRSFGPGPARWAGWLAAFDPLLVFFSGYLLTETLFCFTLLVATFATTEWLKTPRGGRALGAGVLWGVAALTRPTALPLPLLVAAWAWQPLGISTNGRERARQLALLLLGVALCVGPWTLRNGAKLGAFVPVTTGGGRSLLDANNPIVWDDPAQRGGATSVYGLSPYAERFAGRTEVEVDRLSGAMAREFLSERRAQWPRMALAKLGRFWRLSAEGGGTGAWSSDGSLVSRLRGLFDPLLAWSLLTWPLAAYGAWVSLRGPRARFLSLPLWFVLAFSLGTIVYWGSLRLRVPVQPLLALYAAAGLDAIVTASRARRRGMTVIEGGRG
ncbi:MAG: glycosyltransferase family 39 protein [Candidatus Eisenbacteria bacterium]